jgi:hypothetical protein
MFVRRLFPYFLDLIKIAEKVSDFKETGEKFVLYLLTKKAIHFINNTKRTKIM